MDYYRSEIKTGIMAVLCITILVLTTFYVGGSKMWGTAYNLSAAFSGVGGLELDAPVHYAGLEVGMVRDIRIITQEEKERFPDCSLIVDIEVDKLVQVKEDSKILIKTLGFMGLKYIDITPGSNESGLIPAENLIQGGISQDMNDVMESVGGVIEKINPTIDDLKKLINDADEVIVVNKEDINKMISNLSVASEHLKQFAEDIKLHPWKLLMRTKEKKEAPKSARGGEKPKERKSFTGRRTK